MLLRSFQPCPALRPYVKSVGIVHFKFPNGTVIPVKPYAPRPETSLYFFPKDPEEITYSKSGTRIRRAAASIYGQHTALNYRLVGRDFLAVIVHFQPGVLYRITGVPLNELTDRDVDASLLLSVNADVVNEKLNACNSYPEMVSIVEAFVIQLIARCKKDRHPIDAAATYLLQHEGRVSLNWLAGETCFSTRQFERLFTARIGIPAPLLSRINRFHKTIKMRNSQPAEDWLSIGLKCGYHDYQHMVRDYKHFTLQTPPAFFKMEAVAPERSFGLVEEDKVYPR